jgi:hypothetical protein
VEDEALIAFDIESPLESGGYNVIGPFGTIAAAAKAAAGDHSRAAILDVNIKNELVSSSGARRQNTGGGSSQF